MPFPRIPKSVPNLILSVPIFIFVTHSLYSAAWVTGSSMSPTLSTTTTTRQQRRDLVLIQHFNAVSDAQRGEVICFTSPLDPERTLIKRIIGVEGDLVWCPDIAIGGRARPVEDEKNVTVVEGGRGEVREVPRGHVWVEGDGRRWSLDSREFGPVSRALITGRVKGIMYPFERAGKVPEFEGWRKNLVSRVEERRLSMRFA